MGFYERYVFPRVCDAAMREMAPVRRSLLGAARGRVVDLGAGTCENARHLQGIEEYVAVEPAVGMRPLAEANLRACAFPTRFVESSAEQVPLASGAFDTVLCTFVLCTIPSPERALAEARRLLAPGGELLVLEHVVDPDPAIARWQCRVDPVWRTFACGCELARDSATTLARAGFDVAPLEQLDVDAPRLIKHLIRGRLRPA